MLLADRALACHDLMDWLKGHPWPYALVLAIVDRAKDSWAVITDEKPTIQTLYHYGVRFQLEELFLDSKSGVFQLEDSRLRSPEQLSRLYLIIAISLLFGTLNGMAVQCSGLRRQVDLYWKRGISYTLHA